MTGGRKSVFFKVLEKWKTRTSRPGPTRMRRGCHPDLRWANATHTHTHTSDPASFSLKHRKNSKRRKKPITPDVEQQTVSSVSCRQLFEWVVVCVFITAVPITKLFAWG
jgi:hypothetical protein